MASKKTTRPTAGRPLEGDCVREVRTAIRFTDAEFAAVASAARAEFVKPSTWLRLTALRALGRKR